MTYFHFKKTEQRRSISIAVVGALPAKSRIEKREMKASEFLFLTTQRQERGKMAQETPKTL